MIGVDVGGTFTDFLLVDEEGNTRIYKTPTTPGDPGIGTMRGLEGLAQEEGKNLRDFLSQVDVIVHGTTITTNAIITRTYAKTGFITTKGFRDYLNWRDGVKRTVFEPKESPPLPIVPRYLIQGVEERIDCEGREITPLNERDVYAAAEVFRREKIEAIAVNFIFSFLNPSHERRVKEILEKELPGVYVCLGSDVLPQVRIYKRGSTTVFNACVGPVLRTYIASLLEKLGQNGFKGVLLLMQSNGGVMSPEVAMDFAVNTLLSGPAGGPKAGLFYASTHSINNFITVDMGGTSFDACLVRNSEPEMTTENRVSEYAMAVPSLAIHAIGAGGGSIAHIDPGGILRVGPESAGAEPGPACYGIGGEEPTVTDADLILGYLNPDYFLGGKAKLYPDKAERAIKEKIAQPLGLDTIRAAYGIYKVVNANMSQGVRVASVARGYDPREHMLIVAGGAGPVHACDIARELEMPLILVPKVSSVFCAFGMLASDLKHDLVSVCYILTEEGYVDFELINSRYKTMKEKGVATLEREHIPPENMKLTYSCNMRYEGQVHEIEIPVPLSPDGSFTVKELPLLKQVFDTRHDVLYGYSTPESPRELLSLGITAEGITQKPTLREMAFMGEDASAAFKGHREIYYEGELVTVPIYNGPMMGYGNKVKGPAVIEEPTTTIFLTPDYELTCDRYGNYLIYHQGTSLEEATKKLGGSK